MKKIREYVSKLSNSKLGLSLFGAGAGLALLVNNAFADISGKVYDGMPSVTNELVPLQGALVTLKNTGTGAILTDYTDDDGAYRFSGTFSGVDLEVSVVKGLNLAAKAEGVSDGDYHFNLSHRAGVSIDELHSAFVVENGKDNSAVHKDRITGDPIKIYLNNANGNWTSTNIVKIEEIISDVNAQFGYERYVFDPVPRDGTTTFGINLVYDPDGLNKASNLVEWSDPLHVYVRRSKVEINSLVDNEPAIHREICGKSNVYDGASYVPTCMGNPPDVLSDKDVLYINLCDGWRRVEKMMSDNGEAPCHTLYDQTDPQIPVATEDTSWGAMKSLYR